MAETNIHVTLGQAQSIANGVLAKVRDKGYVQETDLGALAKKDKVEKTDLDTGISGEIAAAATKAAENSAAIETLNGTADGSIKKAIDDAFDDFATKVSDDNVVNTYKELVDYAAANGPEMAELVGKVTDLENKTGSIRVATDEEVQAVINALSLD